MDRSAMRGVFRLTDAMWAKFEPLIPSRVNTHKFGGGRLPRPIGTAWTRSSSGYGPAASGRL